MKRTASSTVILMGLWVAAILGIGGSYWINAAQQATAEELAARVREAEAAILAHDWATGAQLLAQVQRDWERTRRLWALHTEHGEMDKITESLVEAAARIMREDGDAAVTLRQVHHQIVTLPRRERLLLENLF